MSRTTRSESSNASACPTSSRFSAISPSRFSSLASISVSKPCSVEVKAAPRSQILFDKRRPLGYRGQGLLLTFSRNCPNNSLPILYGTGKGTARWTPLFPRLQL